MSVHSTPHFDTVYPLLPSILKSGIDDLLARATRESTARYTLDQLLRFSLGRDATDNEHNLESREEWNLQKQKVEKALLELQTGGESKGNGRKRAREEDVPGMSNFDATDPKNKKAKLDSGISDDGQDEPIYTLHSISVSSPIRKKAHITIHHKTIRFTNATSGAQEASLELSSLAHAFLIPTPGKTKPHWTVVLLPNAEQNQIIFGLDAVLPSLTVTQHPASPQTFPKGTESKPYLNQLLSYLSSHIPLQEPSTSHFKSAAGEPFLDAYLRAKDGHLLFFKRGILFGEKKPCMWIGMEEIQNVRSLSATGRTFSLFVKRVATTEEEAEADEDGEGGGEETEFSLIDGKHQDSIARWVQGNRHRFGVRLKENATSQKVGEVNALAEDEETLEKKEDEESEEDDEDYEGDSGSDGSSATSNSSDDEDEEGEGDAEGSEVEGEDEDAEGEDEENTLDPSKHPLLRPGAVPKLSKSAVDMVVRMAEDDMMEHSFSGAIQSPDEDELEDDDEVDELE